MARLELDVALEVLTTRITDLAPAVPIAEVVSTSDNMVRTVPELSVSWATRAGERQEVEVVSI